MVSLDVKEVFTFMICVASHYPPNYIVLTHSSPPQFCETGHCLIQPLAWSELLSGFGVPCKLFFDLHSLRFILVHCG